MPFLTHDMYNAEGVDNPFDRFLLIGTTFWHYIFLYIVMINPSNAINVNPKEIPVVNGTGKNFDLFISEFCSQECEEKYFKHPS